MNVHKLTARFVLVALTSFLLTCCVANTLGQTNRRELTLEWIYGPEGRTVASVPATAWLDDGTLVILDNRRPPAQQTFEKLNPATGQRQSIVDSVRALADLRRAVEGMNVDALPWPIAFDGSGRQAVYIFKGDDALISAGKKFDMMAYPMRKHGISDEAATLHLYRLMLDFWKENL